LFNLKTLFGLPAHPLLVHVPVVLIPLVGIAAIPMAFSRRVRDRLGWIVIGLTIIAGIGTQLAVMSGQALRHSVPPSTALTSHVHMAESLRPLVLVLFVFLVALMLSDGVPQLIVDRVPQLSPDSLGRLSPERYRWLTPAVGLLTIVVAIGANLRLIQIGHSGASATWHHIIVQTAHR
jgi:hypothetical protein